MKDKILKLKILGIFFGDALQDWKENVWGKDLDEPYCCDCDGCECDNDTIRDAYLQPDFFS